MSLTRNERNHVLAQLLRRDWEGFAVTIEKTSHLTKDEKTHLLSTVLQGQNAVDGLDVLEVLRLVNA